MSAPAANRFPFTRTDRRILQLYADGLITKQIATRLNVRPNLVENATARMRRRTGTHTRAHLVAEAVRHGWIK